MGRTAGTSRGRCQVRALGFSLLELLVVLCIIAVLLAIVLPAIVGVHQSAETLECMGQLRSIAFKFRLFADEFAAERRGESDRLAGGRFSVEDFQESLYRIDEFWDAPGNMVDTYDAAHELMICPAGEQFLQRRARVPCRQNGVIPKANVSYTFNMRLDRASVRFQGRWVLAEVRPDPDIVYHPNVPIAFDADGAAATARNVVPYFSAPPGDRDDAYASGRYWFPGKRHSGQTNAAFVGGHVLTSHQPEWEPGWDWRYQPLLSR